MLFDVHVVFDSFLDCHRVCVDVAEEVFHFAAQSTFGIRFYEVCKGLARFREVAYPEESHAVAVSGVLRIGAYRIIFGNLAEYPSCIFEVAVGHIAHAEPV